MIVMRYGNASFWVAKLAIIVAVLDFTTHIENAQAAAVGNRIIFSANNEWKSPDMSQLAVQSGTALDLSGMSNGEAGKYGRAIIGGNGALAFEHLPDVPQRFLGFTGGLSREDDGKTLQDGLANAVQLAEMINRQGYNLWRAHMLDTYLMTWQAPDECVFSSRRLAMVDKLIAELKKRGIYTCITIAAYRCGVADGRRAYREADAMKANMYLGEAEMRRNWKTLAEKMLNHVNPYTGIAWKDDPAIVWVEFFNEQEFAFRNISKQPPAVRERFNAQWRSWLRKKYRTLNSLASAWNKPELAYPENFEKLETPTGMNISGPHKNDFGLFARELAVEEFLWCEKTIRQLGYKGLVTNHNFARSMLDSSVRWELIPLTTMNCYQTHPTNFVLPGSVCRQKSSVGDAAGYWRHANSSAHFADRPIVITEHNFAFWNMYHHEGGLIFPAYSAFQGFSGITVHVNPAEVNRRGPNECFSVARSPIARANEFLAAVLFRRGDVRPAKHRVELQIDSNYLMTNANGIPSVNAEQNKIALLTGFTVAFPNMKHPTNLAAPSVPDLVISPVLGNEIKIGSMYADIDTVKTSHFKVKDIVTKLKNKKILSLSNLSDPGKGIYQNESEEITLREKENLIKVITPRTEGVSLEVNRTEKLNCLDIESSSVPALIAIVSVDGHPLTKSKRMVLIFATDIANTGMELSSDRTTLYKLGALPILLRTGKFAIKLKNANAADLILYALKINGSRSEKIPITYSLDTISVQIDTAKLKDGPAVFFELASLKDQH